MLFLIQISLLLVTIVMFKIVSKGLDKAFDSNRSSKQLFYTGLTWVSVNFMGYMIVTLSITIVRELSLLSI